MEAGGTVTSRVWTRWLRHCERLEDARPLAWLRIALPLCVIADLLRVIQLGLMDTVFVPYADGGLSRIQDRHLLLIDWFGHSAGGIAVVVTLICMVLVSLGTWMRPAIIIGVLAYAQLGHLYPPGDRAIDRIVRTALLILLFSRADSWLSLRRVQTQLIPVWPRQMLRFFLVMVYLSAGLSKLIQQPGWLSFSGTPPLMRILTDPMAANLDAVGWSEHVVWFRLGGFVTIAIELSSPLLLTRFGHIWAVAGLMMHIGIAMTMSLGMFAWGMIAFYPMLLAPFILRHRS